MEMRRDNSVTGVINLIKSLITDEWRLPNNQTGMSFMFRVSKDRRGLLSGGAPDVHSLRAILEDAKSA
jgi:hypothetical protein